MIRRAPRDPRAVVQRLRASLDDRADDYTVTPVFVERVRRLRRRRRLARDTTAALVVTAVIAFAAVFTFNALRPRVDRLSPPGVSPSPTATVDAASPSPLPSDPPSEPPSAKPSPPATPSASHAPSESQSQAPREPELTADTPIDLRGIGPIEAGMTLAEAERAAGVDLVPQYFEDFGGLCYFATAAGLEEDFILMVRSSGSEPVDDPRDGVIARVSATSDMESPAQTLSGIGIGSSEEDVYASYPGRIESQPHMYIEGGHYLTYVPRDTADQGFRVRFFTDGEVVRDIHAGDAEASGAVEGCA
jgi:hypothetical protein